MMNCHWVLGVLMCIRSFIHSSLGNTVIYFTTIAPPTLMVYSYFLADLLRMFFDCLYDEEVISEDAFYKWESSKDPAEQNGKGVALKSVTAFFTWLREAEEESEDN